jgi:hypothetical protein
MSLAVQPGLPADAKLAVPCEIVWYHDNPLLGFAEVGADELAVAFWAKTVRQRRMAALRPLDEIVPEPSQPRLTGMIHQMGRCGSTLLSLQLSAVPGVYTLREPSLFFEILDKRRGSAADRIRRLRSLAAAYGGTIGAYYPQLLIKWAPFAAFYAADIAAAFPDVPAIFLHRDPTEILVSMSEDPPPMFNVFQADWFSPGLKPDDFDAAKPRRDADTAARMIAAVCDAMAAAPGMRSLDYRRLPQAAWDAVAPFFGLSVDDERRRKMMELSKYHAKSDAKKRLFVSDSLAKQSRAGEELRTLACRFVEPRLERLKVLLQPL